MNTQLSGEYYIQFDYEILRDVWYIVELTLTSTSTTTLRKGESTPGYIIKAGRYGPVKMRSTSRFPRFLGAMQDQADPDIIVYDENAALAVIDVLAAPATTDEDLKIDVYNFLYGY